MAVLQVLQQVHRIRRLKVLTPQTFVGQKVHDHRISPKLGELTFVKHSFQELTFIFCELTCHTSLKQQSRELIWHRQANVLLDQDHAELTQRHTSMFWTWLL